MSLPVLLKFPAELGRADAWGRLVELSASSACLETDCVIARHERVLLTFTLGGEAYRDLPATVSWVERQSDGWRSAELDFSDEVEKRRLARALAEALAR